MARRNKGMDKPVEKPRKNQSKKNPAEQQKHNRQISVKLNDNLYQRLHTACEFQEHTAGQLGRILIEWGLPFYEEAKSVAALRELSSKYFIAKCLFRQPKEVASVITQEGTNERQR